MCQIVSDHISEREQEVHTFSIDTKNNRFANWKTFIVINQKILWLQNKNR